MAGEFFGEGVLWMLAVSSDGRTGMFWNQNPLKFTNNLVQVLRMAGFHKKFREENQM